MNRVLSKHLVLTLLALTVLFSPSALAQMAQSAQQEPFAKKPKPPAFVVSPMADTYQPGADITLSSTAKKKMPKGLSFFLGNQLLTPTPIDALSVKLTVPSDISAGTYTLRVASGKRARKTLFSQSITIATLHPHTASGKRQDCFRVTAVTAIQRFTP
jgi:hypothetical protein